MVRLQLQLAGDRLQRPAVKAAAKYGGQPEDLGFGRRQQPVAPVHSLLQCLVAAVHRRRLAADVSQAVLQPFVQLVQ